MTTHDDASQSPSSNADSFLFSADSIKLGVEEKAILDDIDKLREAGVDSLVDLPQIVVVGDQSSGKSSVLEALTGLDFPRADGKCTRFATQIKLRRAREKQFLISIIPDAKCGKAEERRLSGFAFTSPTNASFREIIDYATQTICPPGSPGFWSKHILNIELSGPELVHLTIVDLPGLIHSATVAEEYEYVEAIKDLAFSYMANERSIILAVVSAANDPELQIVLSQDARKFDPKGERTLGVVTKPDKIETREREQQFLLLAKNLSTPKFKLGWHVVRNRSADETKAGISIDERNKKEYAFFHKHPTWRSLGPENLGVEALSKKLSVQLVRHVAHEMPSVQAEIRRRLRECRERLSLLGDRRDSVEGMKESLRLLFRQSQAAAKGAIEGQYNDPHGTPFYHLKSGDVNKEARKLRARIVRANVAFSEEMLTRGHSVEFSEDETGTKSVGGSLSEHPRNELTYPRRMKRSDYIKEFIEPLLDESVGLELQMDRNPLLVFPLFQGFSESWPLIASNHIEAVFELCLNFWREVLDAFWPEDMRTRAWSYFIEGPMEQRLASAKHEASKLFKDRERRAKTYDPEHEKRVLSWLATRQGGNPSDANRGPIYTQVGIADVFLEKMLVYYDLTLKTFISNVIVQVVERQLVDGFEDIFDVYRVGEMDDNQILDVAQEDEWIREERRELKRNKQILEEGEKVCRQHLARSGQKLDDFLHVDKPNSSGQRTPLRQSRSSQQFSSTQRVNGTRPVPTPKVQASPDLSQDTRAEPALGRQAGGTTGQAPQATPRLPTRPAKEPLAQVPQKSQPSQGASAAPVTHHVYAPPQPYPTQPSGEYPQYAYPEFSNAQGPQSPIQAIPDRVSRGYGSVRRQ